MSKCSTELLTKLRQLMLNTKYTEKPLQAYIVPWNDSHNSEYLADCDKRRAFISGFTGSAGTAIITQQHALLWTDGRYYIQAADELDGNWTLMKESLPSTPSQGAYLSKSLNAGSFIGVDPWTISNDHWKKITDELNSTGQTLLPVSQNLIDLLWTDRPARPKNQINIHPVEFAGVTVAEKVSQLRKNFSKSGATVFIVTSLEDVAWLLNLRGSDIEYNPVFFSYAIITQTDIHLFVDDEKLSVPVKNYLEESKLNVRLHDYGSLREFVERELCDEVVWLEKVANRALVSLVALRNRVKLEVSPVSVAKCVKNSTEAAGMQNCHVRDGAALCRYFHWLHTQIASNSRVTELSGAHKLLEFRAQEPHFVGASFETISSVGSHAAIIHHRANAATDRQIDTDNVYLCDSGGQYFDGTTDVTRTLHFGVPSRECRESFTRVLQGQIALATMVFPAKIRGNCLDSFARKALWSAGQDYAHGTGHGVGSFLCVHEGPIAISWRPCPDDPGLKPNMFVSNEPGYYEAGNYGIRLENIEQIVSVDNMKDFLGFNTVTLVPVQRDMIVIEMLTDKEKQYLNKYHERCRQTVGLHLKNSGHLDVLDWLCKNTEPI